MSLGQDHERLNRVADDGVRDGGDSLLFESSPDEGAGAHRSCLFVRGIAADNHKALRLAAGLLAQGDTPSDFLCGECAHEGMCAPWLLSLRAEGAGAHIIINFDSANPYLNTFFIRGPSSRRRFTGSLLNTRRTY